MSGYVTTGNYEVVEYLEASETQYFDTGFTPNQDTGVKCKFKMLDIDNSNSHLFGSGQTYQSQTFECYLWDHKLEFNYNNGYTFGDEVHIGDVIEIDWNKNIIKYRINDGVWKTITMSYGNFTTPGSMWVFLNNRVIGYTSVSSNSQLYYFEVYDNGTLVRNYKPAQSLDGTSLGLYDTVNDTFITNSGTGEFISGEPTGEFVDTKTSTRLKVNASRDITQLDYDLAECEDSWFSKYTRVNYLDNPGGAYIDIGYYPCQDTCVEIDCQYNDQSSGLQWIFGSRDDYSENIFALSPNNGISQFIYGYNTSIGNYNTPNVPCDTNRHTYKLDCGKCYYDGVLQFTYSKQTFRCTTTMSIFSCHSPKHGGYYTNANAKLYRMKIWEYGVLQYDFVPCIRKSDMKAGLYDMVNKQFLSSATGISFIPGPIESHFDYQKFHMYCARPIYQIDIDIADKIDGWFGDYIRCDYIESTNDGTDKGQQMIDTGIYGNLETSYEVKVAHNYAGTPVEAGGLIIGSRESATSRNISSFANYNTVGTNDFGDYSVTRLIDDNTCDTNDIIFYNSKNYRYIEHNGTKLETSTVYSTPFTTPYTLRLFGVTPGFWTAHYNFWGKMYYCKIWNNGELVRDYIPSIRRSDLKAGLYDLVTCEFYTSNSGYDFIPGGRQYEFNFIKY